MMVHQGDVFWVAHKAPDGTEPGYPHPHVIVQDDILNHSGIDTVVVCLLTSNIKRANWPGNVLLEAGEANLAKQSVVEVSRVFTIKRTQVGKYIGTLSQERVCQILDGMQFLHSLMNRRE